MNLFNSFQAVAFYTAVPLAVQYLATHDFTAWAVILGVGEFAGFCLLSVAVHESSK